jgi:hypothetical protein
MEKAREYGRRLRKEGADLIREAATKLRLAE